jgi:hypothetical protein
LGKKSITVWKGRKIYNRTALYGGVEGESMKLPAAAYSAEAVASAAKAGSYGVFGEGE